METKIVNTDTKTYTVRALNGIELREWWNKIATPGHSCDVFNEYALPGISLDDLAIMCDCTAADFDGLTYRELDAILTAAKELNPHMFRLRELLRESCAKLVEILEEAFTNQVKEELQ